jgi:hypothetical protein
MTTDATDVTLGVAQLAALTAALTDAEAAEVLDILAVDPRSAELVPVVRTMIVSLAPMFGVDKEAAADDGPPAGIGAVFDAMADAVFVIRNRRAVAAYHAQNGDSWRDDG